MPESVLTLLKFCLVAVLYLFFFRVLRAVWAEVRQPDVAPAPSPQAARAPVAPPPPAARTARPPPLAASPRPAGRPGWLRVVKPPPMSGASFQLTEAEATVGRAPGCAVLLDDPTVSSLHARLTQRGDQIVVEDLGSRNGTLLNGRRLKAPTAISPGDRLGIGPNVELEVLP
jgi:hypothetical protein